MKAETLNKIRFKFQTFQVVALFLLTSTKFIIWGFFSTSTCVAHSALFLHPQTIQMSFLARISIYFCVCICFVICLHWNHNAIVTVFILNIKFGFSFLFFSVYQLKLRYKTRKKKCTNRTTYVCVFFCIYINVKCHLRIKQKRFKYFNVYYSFVYRVLYPRFCFPFSFLIQ